jgi:uncharacterized protein (TIGR02594 family)
MVYRIKFEGLKLRQAPSVTADSDADPVDLLDRIAKIDKAFDENGQPWSHVEVFRPGQRPRRGFIADNRLEEIPAHELRWPEEIDRVQFISVLTTAARKYGTNRDYLALVAQMESGIRNIPSSAASGATGPFQFTPAKWNELVEFEAKLDSPSGVTVDDISTPWLQPLMAALLTAQNAEALLHARGKVPTGLDLYLAHVFGLDTASAVLAAREQDETQTIDTVLRAALGQQEADKLLQDPKMPRLSNGSPRTVAAVIGAFEQRMHEAIAQVAPDIARLPNDLKFPHSVPSSEPPWLAEARREDGVREVPGKGFEHSNPRIEAYHKAAGDRAPDDVPWCASFVSFCMARTQNDVVRAHNLASKTAVAWLEWGEPVTDPPVGAVCVMKPVAEGTTGHVGFFLRRDGADVWLLGGNQGDTVCEKPFKAADVRGYRWLNWLQAPGSMTTVGDVQNSSAITEAQTLELLNKVKNGVELLPFAAQIHASAQRWRINPIFSLAQSAYETGWWTSSAFQDLHNVGGLSKAGHHYADSGTPGRSENNGRRWETFNTPGDSFNAKMWLLKARYIDEGRTTIRGIIEKYAPETENDVGRYVVAVERIMGDMFARLGIQVG